MRASKNDHWSMRLRDTPVNRHVMAGIRDQWSFVGTRPTRCSVPLNMSAHQREADGATGSPSAVCHRRRTVLVARGSHATVLVDNMRPSSKR